MPKKAKYPINELNKLGLSGKCKSLKAACQHLEIRYENARAYFERNGYTITWSLKKNEH